MAGEPDTRFLYLVDAYGETLLRAARLLCGDWTQAEELLQRTLARTLIQWDPHQSEQVAAARAQLELVATYLDELPEEPPDGRHRATARHSAAVQPPGPLLAALDELDPMVRATVIGRYYLRLTDRDIAGLLGVEPGRARHVGARSLDWLDRRRRLAVTGHPVRATAGAG